jgi:hypothetical protein
VSFSCCLDNNFSPDSWSDTLITGMVDVDPGAAGQTVTVTVGATGYNGFSFQAGPGQTSQASTTVPVTGCTVAEQNQIIQEYVTYGVVDTTSGNRWQPICSYFTQTAQSVFYSANQLGNFSRQPHHWALVKNPLTVSGSSGYGLDDWTDLLFEAGWGLPLTQNILSTYRPPAYNAGIGSVNTSRHQFGDAVDIQNVSGTQAEHDAKSCWAGQAAAAQFAQLVTPCSMMFISADAQADYVEPVSPNLGCGSACVHADWRSHDNYVYSQ